MDSDGFNKQMRVLFSGRVQGVGFRYTACQIAGSLEVTGCVRNLGDGNVEVVAEGKEQELVNFLNKIRASRLSRYIMQEQLQWSASTGKYKIFGVSF